MASALFASSLVFFALRILPGDAALNLSGMEATPDQIAAARRGLGLDRPLILQYLSWLSGMARGDFGKSYLSGLPVAREIGRRLPITLPLSVLAFCLSVLLSVPLGIAAAAKRKKPFGAAVQAVSSLGVAVPAFWIGIILVWLLALKARAFPAGGFPRAGWAEPLSALWSLALPVITIALVMAASLVRYVRSVAIDVLGQDYLRTARSLGYSRRRAGWRHGLRNMAVPLISVMSIELATSLLGAVVVENVFAIPGLGSMLLQGIRSRDFPVVQDLIFLITSIVLLIGFLSDLAQRAIDPRLRRGEGGR